MGFSYEGRSIGYVRDKSAPTGWPDDVVHLLLDDVVHLHNCASTWEGGGF
jgi:hypothetical protein